MKFIILAFLCFIFGLLAYELIVVCEETYIKTLTEEHTKCLSINSEHCDAIQKEWFKFMKEQRQ